MTDNTEHNQGQSTQNRDVKRKVALALGMVYILSTTACSTIKSDLQTLEGSLSNLIVYQKPQVHKRERIIPPGNRKYLALSGRTRPNGNSEILEAKQKKLQQQETAKLKNTKVVKTKMVKSENTEKSSFMDNVRSWFKTSKNNEHASKEPVKKTIKTKSLMSNDKPLTKGKAEHIVTQKNYEKPKQAEIITAKTVTIQQKAQDKKLPSTHQLKSSHDKKEHLQPSNDNLKQKIDQDINELKKDVDKLYGQEKKLDKATEKSPVKLINNVPPKEIKPQPEPQIKKPQVPVAKERIQGHEIPKKPDLPVTPAPSEVPGLPKKSDLPVTPAPSEVLELPKKPDLPLTPAPSEVPALPKKPDLPVTPAPSEVPALPKLPELPSSGEKLTIPIVPELSEDKAEIKLPLPVMPAPTSNSDAKNQPQLILSKDVRVQENNIKTVAVNPNSNILKTSQILPENHQVEEDDNVNALFDKEADERVSKILGIKPGEPIHFKQAKHADEANNSFLSSSRYKTEAAHED